MPILEVCLCGWPKQDVACKRSVLYFVVPVKKNRLSYYFPGKHCLLACRDLGHI